MWWILFALWIGRLVAMTLPTQALWGLDPARYLSPGLAWTTWLLMGAALVPPVGRALTQVLERVGREYEVPTRRALIGLFAIVGLVVFNLPDRVGFTGDFLLRLSSAKASGSPATIFPQALPLDLFLHYTVPHELARLRIAPVDLTSRVIGALEAGCLALAVVMLARRAGLRGAALACASLVMLVGAPLALFTGLNKAFTELLVLAAVMAACAWPSPSPSFARTLGMLAAFALALALHRGALVLAPVVGFGVWQWLRSSARDEPAVRRGSIVAMLGVTVALAWRAVIPVTRLDLPGGMIWPLRDDAGSLGMRLLDLANLAVLLAPSLLLVPAVRRDSRVGDDFRGVNAAWFLCLAIPSALMILSLDAPQGYFRDWDLFAIAGLLLTIVSAVLIGRVLTRADDRRWLGAAIMFSTALPAFQLLALQTNASAGLRRVAAFTELSPQRDSEQRASVYAFLAKRAWDRDEVATAADQARNAAMLVPTPSMLTLWAEAEERQGNAAAAESVYVRLATRFPRNARAWLGLARVRLRSADLPGAATAAERAMAIEPSSQAAELIQQARSGGTR